MIGNSKSGNNDGSAFLNSFRGQLNPLQGRDSIQANVYGVTNHKNKLQGDTSRLSKPPVGIDVKVAFTKDFILKRNFQIKMSTGGFDKHDVSPCILLMDGFSFLVGREGDCVVHGVHREMH